jgi:hypothetical protein
MGDFLFEEFLQALAQLREAREADGLGETDNRRFAEIQSLWQLGRREESRLLEVVLQVLSDLFLALGQLLQMGMDALVKVSRGGHLPLLRKIMLQNDKWCKFSFIPDRRFGRTVLRA